MEYRSVNVLWNNRSGVFSTSAGGTVHVGFGYSFIVIALPVSYIIEQQTILFTAVFSSPVSIQTQSLALRLNGNRASEVLVLYFVSCFNSNKVLCHCCL